MSGKEEDKWRVPAFAVGDRVSVPDHPEWGVGVVTLAPRPGNVGRQVLYVRFSDGRTRTIDSTGTPLKLT